MHFTLSAGYIFRPNHNLLSVTNAHTSTEQLKVKANLAADELLLHELALLG